MSKITIFRFEKKINKTHSCWLWTGAVNGPRQYGVFTVNGKMKLAHRVSYELYVGKIPEGLNVLHKCDNPNCVNPSHLFMGTQADNMKDMFDKGRQSYQLYPEKMPKGETHGMAKLTRKDIEEIKNKRLSGNTLRSIAEEYGIGTSQVHRISRGEQWRV